MIFRQNGSWQSITLAKIPGENQPTAEHATSFPRQPVFAIQGPSQFVITIRTRLPPRAIWCHQSQPGLASASHVIWDVVVAPRGASFKQTVCTWSQSEDRSLQTGTCLTLRRGNARAERDDERWTASCKREEGLLGPCANFRVETTVTRGLTDSSTDSWSCTWEAFVWRGACPTERGRGHRHSCVWTTRVHAEQLDESKRRSPSYNL